MAKIGRNEPCPCKSGNKYKRCCLAADEAASAAKSRADEEQRRQVAELLHDGGGFAAHGPAGLDDDDRLDELSNGALDLIRAGRLDEAEAMCQQLLSHYPDLFDGHMRLGQLHRVRGDAKKAAEHLRLAAAIAQSLDNAEIAASLLAEADQLDPPAP